MVKIIKILSQEILSQMNLFQKNFTFLLIFFILFSCSSFDKNPLVIPPNFTEVPDLNNIENTSRDEVNPSKGENQENIDRIKKLLQESD